MRDTLDRDRTVRVIFGALIALSFTIALIVVVIYQAVKDGTIWAILAVFGGVILVIVLSARQLSEAFRTFREAQMIGKAEKYERDDRRKGISHTIVVGRTMIDHSRMPELSAPAAPTSTSNTPNIASVRYPDSLTDVKREAGLKVLEATLKHTSFGPLSTKVITQTEAGAVGINSTEWQNGVDYLCNYYDVYTDKNKGRKNGVYVKAGKTVANIMRDTAVYSLPAL